MEFTVENDRSNLAIDERIATLASNILNIYERYQEDFGMADRWVTYYVSDLVDGEAGRWYDCPSREVVRRSLEIGRSAFFNGMTKEDIHGLVTKA